MGQVLVIGYGNPLRCDDGLGWRAAQELSKETLGPGVQIQAVQQLTVELAEPVSKAEFAIFIDACWDIPPGRIRSSHVHADESWDGSATMHYLTPPLLLAVAQLLYGRCPDANLISMGGETFERGGQFSRSVAAAFPALLARVRECVGQRLAGTTPRRGHHDA
jgi:hydrogenase maturation protease